MLPFTGLSLTTSLIGLTLYSLLILLRNMLAGMESCQAGGAGVSARALGYTGFPLLRYRAVAAAALLFAGLRIASVTLVGLVTVTALIGPGQAGTAAAGGF